MNNVDHLLNLVEQGILDPMSLSDINYFRRRLELPEIDELDWELESMANEILTGNNDE